MKILYVCHRFPFPPREGGRIRPFFTIKHLASNHAVTVASLLRSDREAADGAGLRDHCAKVIAERISEPLSVARMIARLPTSAPSTMGYFYSHRLAQRIRAEVRATHYDLTLVHCSSMAQYVTGTVPGPKILDFADIDSEKWLAYARHRRFPLSVGYALEGWKLRRVEMALARQFDLCTCTTPEECRTLERFGTARRTAWFPNGVDTDFFAPTDGGYDANTICFIGNLAYYPNQECTVDFCTRTFPLLRRRWPTARLFIVGAAPPRRVRRLGAIPGVTVTGFVPDVRPYLRRAALSIAPLSIARGVQNKILESMAMGVPVVCSPLAARGADVVPGEHLLTADTPQGYADAIVHLLQHPAERQRFAVAGRARAVSHHSWELAMQKLDQLVGACLTARQNASSTVAATCSQSRARAWDAIAGRSH